MLCWTIVALLMLWLLLRHALPRPIDLPPERLSIDIDADTPAAAATLASHLNSPHVPGNRIRLLRNGDRIFPPMLAAIREARESINLLTFIYWRGEIAHTFADELAAAAQRGVEVRVLLDAYGAKKMDPRCIELMERGGCAVAWFHPLRWNTLDRINHRTHRKVLVTDGRIGFTGGVGIAAEWTGDAQDADHWRDNHFRLEGPVVRHLQGAFAENWRQATGEVLAGEAMFPSLEPVGDAEIVSINAVGDQRFSGIPLTYWLLFHCARKRVLVATPYFAPDPDLELGLTNAARRGVEVTVLIPGPYQDSTLVRHASRSHYRRLLDAGVRLFEYQPTLLHTKTVVVDGRWALIGSSNFDARSLRLNHEIALAVFDRGLADELADSLADDLAGATEVTAAALAHWSWRKHLRSSLARLLHRQI